jgi:hypothetical protein
MLVQLFNLSSLDKKLQKQLWILKSEQGKWHRFPFINES